MSERFTIEVSDKTAAMLKKMGAADLCRSPEDWASQMVENRITHDRRPHEDLALATDEAKVIEEALTSMPDNTESSP
jgi:hypothetical protein